ncbi:MAG: hypothetical protein EZS28_014533 [Streblomastix strix]|uniref:Uncharacterized protein n=1 Tax=Streblomastix strix TaxID=222440 RepID=A0A5J4W4M0_9EUKA|nr:MAG: hypothetical protein EZS28_014533 [Streblomastix strix]
MQIQCLAICFKIDENNELIQKAITILSPIISHTGSFTLLSLARIFKFEFINDVKTCFWYSDGGPHFRNQQVVCMLLRNDVPLIKDEEFQVSFWKPYHGKGRVDQEFGAYVRTLKRNMSQQSIRSIVSLQEELEKFLSFRLEKDSFVCSKIINGIKEEEVRTAMKIKTRDAKSLAKRSTVAVDDSDYIDHEVSVPYVQDVIEQENLGEVSTEEENDQGAQ